MLRRRAAGTAGRRRYRNAVNHVSGYILGFGLLVLVVGLDPWGLYSARGDSDVPLNLQFCGFFGALSVLGYRMGAHPRLDGHPDHLVVVGVTRDITAPVTAVTGLDATCFNRDKFRTKAVSNTKWALAGAGAGKVISTADKHGGGWQAAKHAASQSRVQKFVWGQPGTYRSSHYAMQAKTGTVLTLTGNRPSRRR